MDMVAVGRAAYSAGLRKGTHIEDAIAIAFAESTGNPRAHNTRPPDDSYGLWQINMRGDLGPSRRKQFNLTSNDQLYDPAINARAMYAISRGGTDWDAWTTYKGLRYYAFLPAARVAAAAALAAAGAAGVADKASETIDAATDAAQQGVGAVIKTGKWLSDRNNIYRIAKVIAGGALLIGGVVIAASPVSNKVLETVTPAGKVLGTVGKIAGKAK